MIQRQELDFTPQNTILEEVLFDVDIVDLQTSGNLFGRYRGISVPSHKALLNQKTGEVLSVVSKNYRVLTNREALELGKKAFHDLFPLVNKDEFIPYKVITSKKKSYCIIDLVHKSVNFNVWEQETWLPFLRITNSYNRMFALSFEVGFVRKLCSNGVIFDKKTVKVKYLHTNEGIPANVSVDVSAFRKLEADFRNHLVNLKRFYFPSRYMFPLLCKVLEVKHTFDSSNPFARAEEERFYRLRKDVKELSKSYFEDSGDNAFSALNVLTDVVSHQDSYKSLANFAIRANMLYLRTSDWVRTFTEEAEKRDFVLDNYLKDFLLDPILEKQ